MSYALPHDEVAEDFGQALRDMGPLNSRIEISNLTIIAKENTEHALAISEALKTYIKQTSPQKKLPAFYVLDSIVKNVGTPYTLFFGRQLYATFMGAYVLMDNNTRRKMDEMLKTWKEPVPGSIDTRPVFPPDVTRPIETALIKARTSAVEAQQEHFRSQQQLMGRARPPSTSPPYRETPTPPQGPPGVARPPIPGPTGYNAGYSQQQYPPSQSYPNLGNGLSPQPQPHGLPPRPPPQQFPQQYPQQQMQPYPQQSQQYQQQQYPVQNVQQYPQQPPQQYGQQFPPQAQYPNPQANQYPQYPQQTSQEYGQEYGQGYPQQVLQQPPNVPSWQQQQPVQEYHAPQNSIDTLNSDIAKCIGLFKTAFAQNPLNQDVQSRLKTLLDLQIAMSSQQPAAEQLAAIKTHVDGLFQYIQALPNNSAVYSPPVPVAPAAPLLAVPIQAPAPAQAPVQQTSLSSLLGSGALAALLARQSATPQPTPPPQPATAILSPPQTRPAQLPQPIVAPTSHPDPISLLERLRAAGMLSGTPNTPPPSGALLGRGPSGLPPSLLNTPPTSRTPLGEIPNDVVLQAGSLKIPRPHLIAGLYQGLGVPCAQCGRRFKTDEEGRKKKTGHMDWHFRVHQRMTEAEKKGQHRSWYLDEFEWIKSRELDEDQITTTDGQNGQAGTGPTPQAKPEIQYIPAPDGDEGINTVCPICQEKFEQKWLDEAQEWVWMDARKVNERAYHASCYAEVNKDGSNSQLKRGTPEPILGKRKAEDEHIAVRTKIKIEP